MNLSKIFRRDELKKSFENNSLYKEVTLTASDIANLNATPYTIVEAPSSGKIVEFISAVIIYDYGTTQFTGGGSLVFQQSTTGNDYSVSVASSQLTAAGDSISFVPAFAGDYFESDPAENDAIVLTNGTAPFAAGDGVLRVKINYRVHNTGL